MFGFIPHNIELYKLALIHKSASIVLEDGQHINNERLEFLGDAVLECVSSDYLFIEYPDKNEGFLTKLRSKMVSRQTLNEVAKRIGLDEYVITHSSNNISQKHIYGDAFEAMMGAIYLDQGYDFVNRLLINKIFVDYIKVDQLNQAETDFKSRLIEWCQKNHHTIHFDTENDKSYSSTHPFFYSKVFIDGIEMGYGAGESKKEAEQRAAYSVSRGFTDEDCTKLLDKLDAIDARDVKPKREAKRDVVREPKAEPKAESRAEPKVEPATEAVEQPKVEPKAESGEGAAKRSRRSRKPAAKVAEVANDEATATEDIKAEEKPAEVIEVQASEPNADEVKDAKEGTSKPSRRRQSSRRKSGVAPKNETLNSDSAGVEEAESTEPKADTEANTKADTEPAKSVKRSPRRRKPKAKEEAAEQSATTTATAPKEE